MPINAVFALLSIVTLLIVTFHVHQFKCDTFFLNKKIKDDSGDWILIRTIEQIYCSKKPAMHYFALNDWYNEMKTQMAPLCSASVRYAVQDDTVVKLTGDEFYPFNLQDYIFIFKGDNYYFDSSVMKSELITTDHPKWYLMFQMH